MNFLFPLTDTRYSRDQQIKDQIDVLNTDYALTGLRWRHTNTTRTKNIQWFDSVAPSKSVLIRIFNRYDALIFIVCAIYSEHENNMKLTLRTGDATTLNIYSVGYDPLIATKFLLCIHSSS